MGSRRKLRSMEGGRISNEKTGNAASASRALDLTETNPLDLVPDKIPFDTPYGPPISLDRAQEVIQVAVGEAKKRNWKLNVAVVDSGAKPRSSRTVSTLCISTICSLSMELLRLEAASH